MDYLHLKQKSVVVAEKCAKFAQSYGFTENGVAIQKITQVLKDGKLALMAVGEARTGKSSMLGAYLEDDELFPVDIDITTCLITMVSYAEREKISVVQADKSDKEYVVTISRAEIPEYAKEQNNRRGEKRAKLILIETPNPKLKDGLVVIDSPGIGSMNPAHSKLTYQFLPRADIVLYVCDATSQISEPELIFLKSVKRSCENILFILTKKDMQANHESIITQNKASIATTAGIPENEQTHIAISSRMMNGYRRSGDPEYLAESNFEQLHQTIWDMISRRRPRIVILPRALELRYEMDKIEQLIIVDETAYGADREKVERLKRDLADLKQSKQRLMQNNAQWQDDIAGGVSQLETALSTMLNRYSSEAMEYVAEKLRERAYMKNPQMLVTEVIGMTEQQVRQMQECTEDTINAMQHTFMEKSKLNISIKRGSLDLTVGSGSNIRFEKVAVTERIVTGGRKIGGNSFGMGAFGTVAGGVLGAIAGFFTAGPAGAVIGAQYGAAAGGTLGSAFGLGKGAYDAIKTDVGYDVQKARDALARYISQTVQEWNNEKRRFVSELSRNFVSELRKTVAASIAQTEENIGRLNDTGGMSAAQLDKARLRIEGMRAEYDGFAQEVDRVVEESGMEGETVQAGAVHMRMPTSAAPVGGQPDQGPLELDQ